jgi:hypothetical protein
VRRAVTSSFDASATGPSGRFGSGAAAGGGDGDGDGVSISLTGAGAGVAFEQVGSAAARLMRARKTLRLGNGRCIETEDIPPAWGEGTEASRSLATGPTDRPRAARALAQEGSEEGRGELAAPHRGQVVDQVEESLESVRSEAAAAATIG